MGYTVEEDMTDYFSRFCDLIDTVIRSQKAEHFEDTMYAKALHSAVNEARRELGKSKPVTLELVARVERMAVGHSDYCEKFARYCVELVNDTSPLMVSSSE